MDETAQPGNEQVGVGDEASVTPTNAWQPGSNGGYRDNGSRRAPSLRTADAPWSSAGAALEPSVEPAANGWRRSATSGLRGRAEVRTRYADLLAPVSPAIPPPHAQADEIPSSAPPYPYEGDLPADSRAWAPPRAADRPPAIPAERVAPPAGYDPYHPSGALTDPTYDDLPALAQQAAAASHAASAARAASAAAAAAEARAMVDDRAAVQAAFRNATNAAGTPVPPPASAPPAPPAEQHHPMYRRPAEPPTPQPQHPQPTVSQPQHPQPQHPQRQMQQPPAAQPPSAQPPSAQPPSAQPPSAPPRTALPPAGQAPPAEYRPPFPPVNGTEPGRANGTPRPPVNGFGHSAPPTNGAGDPRGPVPPADHRPPGVLWPAELQRAAEAQQVAEVPGPAGYARPADFPRPAQPTDFQRPAPGPAGPSGQPVEQRPQPGQPGELRPPPNDLRLRQSGEFRTPPASPPMPHQAAVNAPVSAAPVSAAPISGVPVSATPVSATPLPQRIPALPDVPEFYDEPDDTYVEPGGPTRVGVDKPELARIATGLRYKDDFQEQAAPPPEGFDFEAVLAAVRKVPGVRDAALKPNESGVHTLRLDLDEGADPALVSRLVARLLKQKMGLAAEPRRPTAPPRLPPQPGGPEAAAAAEERARQRHPVTPVRARGDETENRRPVRPGGAPRVVLDQVQVSTLGMDATVEVRLTAAGGPAIGVASGPAVDGYVLRLAAVAATSAIDQLLARVTGDQHGRSFVEHAAVVPFGSCEVAVTVILLAYSGTVEQLTGSALVAGDPRQAVVRATLAAVNRRLEALLG